MQNKGPAMCSCDITHYVEDCSLLGAQKKKCNWTGKSEKGIAKIFKETYLSLQALKAW